MTRTAQPFVIATQLVVILLTVATAGRAMAQWDPEHYRYEYTTPTAFHNPTPPWPVEMGFSYHHASTVAEGYLRGQAAVIQARANYEFALSQARILNQQALAAGLENKVRLTETHFARQEMLREGRWAEREHREAKLEEGREKLLNRRASVHRHAYQLSPTDLNVITGEINWPAALQTAKYQRARAWMEELFRQHVSYGDPQPAVVREIARGSTAMTRALQKEIRTLDRADYVAAQKFLRGLKLEASA